MKASLRRRDAQLFFRASAETRAEQRWSRVSTAFTSVILIIWWLGQYLWTSHNKELKKKTKKRCFQNASAIVVRRVFSLPVAVFMSELSSGLFWSEWKRRAAASPSRHRHTNPYLFFCHKYPLFLSRLEKVFPVHKQPFDSPSHNERRTFDWIRLQLYFMFCFWFLCLGRPLFRIDRQWLEQSARLKSSFWTRAALKARRGWKGK